MRKRGADEVLQGLSCCGSLCSVCMRTVHGMLYLMCCIGASAVATVPSFEWVLDRRKVWLVQCSNSRLAGVAWLILRSWRQGLALTAERQGVVIYLAYLTYPGHIDLILYPGQLAEQTSGSYRVSHDKGLALTARRQGLVGV